MSVKPVAWRIKDKGRISPIFVAREETAKDYSADARYEVTPLYSAPAPELAEALQRMVNHGLFHAIGCAQPCDCGARELDTEARKLLARITPK